MRALNFLLFFGIINLTIAQNVFQNGKLYRYDVKGVRFLPFDKKETKMDYKLKVVMTGPNKYIMQAEEIKISGEQENMADIGLSDKIRFHLESPMEVTMSRGVIKYIKMPQNIPPWVIKIKKIQASHFLLNPGLQIGTYYTRDNIVKTNNEYEDDEYVVNETSYLGQCTTKYTVIESKLFTPIRSSATSNRNTQSSSDEESEEDFELSVSSEESEETMPVSSATVNAYERLENLDTVRQWCETGDKFYEFTKTADLRNCTRKGSTSQKVGTITSRFVACGRDKNYLTILAIVHRMVKELSDASVQKLVLLSITPASSNLVPILSGPVREIQDVSVAPDSKQKNMKLKYCLEDDEKESVGSQNVNESQILIAYRQCIERNGVPEHILVERDLNSDRYTHLNLQWNLRRKKVFPLAYYLPRSAEQVVHAVKCGIETKLHVVPNSGGSSYEAIGWGTNDTLVVDFRDMKKIQIEGSGQNAMGIMQPGALVGPTNAYFWENGGYAMPMGNCLTVGLGGHVVGGGVGYFSPLYGLTLDNILEYQIVDSYGKILVANAVENSDLFWALRGVGPGYIGIVTRVKVKLFEASKIKMTLMRFRYQVKHFAEVWVGLQNIQEWFNKNDPTVFIGITLVSDTYNASLPSLEPGMTVIGLHIQDPDRQPQGNEAFTQAMYQFLPQPAEIIIDYPNYIQFIVMTGYAPVILPSVSNGELLRFGRFDHYTLQHNRHVATAMDLPSEPEILAYLKLMSKDITAPRYFKAKSFFIKEHFTLEQMQVVGAKVAEIPQNNIWFLINTEQGKIQEVVKNATAYVHRDVLLDFSIHYEGSPDQSEVDTGMKYLYELWDTIEFMDGGQSYQNYPDLDVQDHLERFYKSNLPRLIQSKIKWDPTNYFQAKLSLPVNIKG